MVWGFFVVIPGVLCQVASLAEMSSIQPIAGAQYHWTWHLAPPSSRRFITWIQGWITWFSWISLLCSVANTAANITTALVGISYPDWAVQGWQTILIMYAYLIVFGLMNMYVVGVAISAESRVRVIR
jgi:choline transport protein